MKKRIVKLAASALLLLAVGTLLLASIGAPLQAAAVTLQRETAVAAYTGQGTVVYKSTLDIVSPVSGGVTEVPVGEGQAVKAGDTIAVVHAPDVDYQIQRLEADIRGYQAQITNLNLSEQKERDTLAGSRGQLEGQLTTIEAEKKSRENAESTREEQISLQENIVWQDRANVNIARTELRNYRKEYDADSADPEYNQLRAAVNDAEKSLYASEQALLQMQSEGTGEGYYEGQQESVKAQISSIDDRMGKSYGAGMREYYAAQIQIAQVSIRELSEQQGKATVAAPYDCIISSLTVKEGMQAEQGDMVAVLGCTPVVEVLVPVREMDGIGVGDSVSLTVSKRAGDELTDGTVLEIADQAQIQLSPLGVEESKIRVLVQAERELAVGSQADVEFTVYRRENSLVLPQKALFQMDGQDCVWVIEEGEARIRPVAKGAEVRGGTIIAEGLQEGDVVIADANLQGLAEGKKVAQAD